MEELCYDQFQSVNFFKEAKMRLVGLALLFLLLMSCGDEDEGNSGGNGGDGQASLRLEQVAQNTYGFFSFDNIFDTVDESDSDNQYEIAISGATFYSGTLSAHDGAKVRVYAALVPGATIDRVLIQINGGTGTDPRHGLKHYNHKAVVMVDMRGLHTDDIEGGECPLGGALVSCLKGLSWLKQINPRDNGRDVVSVMKAILGEGVSLTVDGQTRDHSFFGVTDPKFNVETGSYGATILGYALARPDLPPIGRIFMDGPSSPGEYVITDGFRNTNVALDNMLTAMGMDDTQKTTFIGVMKARHTAPNTTCEEVDGTDGLDDDCLSSAMIWGYLKDQYQNTGEVTYASLKTDLVGISDTDMGVNNELVTKIRNGSGMARDHTTWESSKFDFTTADGPFNGRKEPGFASRVGQICSAYISRRDGDSQSRFDTAKAKTSNDPYWYGFLIGYRVFLDICPQLAGNLTTGISIPSSSLNVSVEALVQYGAGADEKHHQADMLEMASYVDGNNGVVETVYMPFQTQGGDGRANATCAQDLRTAAFETPTATLTSGLSTVKSNSCGL